MNGGVSTDVNIIRGLISAWLTVEFAYYKMVCDLDTFTFTWGLNDVLCKLEDGVGRHSIHFVNSQSCPT